MGIDVLPPDINTSGWDFTIEDRPEGGSCHPLWAGGSQECRAGPGGHDHRCQARRRPFHGPERLCPPGGPARKVGKRALECLIRVGALDRFGQRRSLLEALEQIFAISASHFRAANSGQLSFFGTAEGVEEKIVLPSSRGVDTPRAAGLGEGTAGTVCF